MGRPLTQRVKPPTIPKPFRLSSTNRAKVESVSNKSNSRSPKSNKAFKAKEIPKSHRVPFMVLHSTKNLTKPENFKLHTDERSVSKNRDGAKTKIYNTSRNFNKNETLAERKHQNLQNEKSQNQCDIKNERNINVEMFNFDIDEFIRKEEAKIL